MSLQILRREAWGAKPDLPRRGHPLGPHNRTEVFIHHTVASASNEFETLDEVRAAMRMLQTVRPDLGLDVPYNMVAFCMVGGDLVLGEGRGLLRTAAHATGHNRSGLGIAFHGNFENEPLPAHFDAQLEELTAWLRHLRTEEGFVNLGTVRPEDRDLWGHRDVKSTLCPGRHLFDRLPQIRFMEASAWSQPGDSILTEQDERRVFEVHGALSPDDVPASLRRQFAVILDELLQFRDRLGSLEDPD